MHGIWNTSTKSDRNEHLKGVSRVESLKLILKMGSTELDPTDFEAALANKNAWYLEYINKIRSQRTPERGEPRRIPQIDFENGLHRTRSDGFRSRPCEQKCMVSGIHQQNRARGDFARRRRIPGCGARTRNQDSPGFRQQK